MAAAHHDDEGLFSGINVTPLVDITLVLLIVFMVAAPIMMQSPSIKVALPKAATAETTEKSTLSLTMQRDPAPATGGAGYKLFANGKAADEGGVRTLVAGLVGKNPDLQAVIAADKGIAYGEVMHIVDLVRGLGVSKFALHTEAVQ